MVLGGSGFLGKNIIKKLVQDTGNTIYAYDKYIDYEFFKEEVTVVLGGAALLLEMYSKSHLDMAYVSTINSATPLSADVYLHHHITTTNSTATRMDYAVGHNADKSLSFVQELVTY